MNISSKINNWDLVKARNFLEIRDTKYVYTKTDEDIQKVCAKTKLTPEQVKVIASISDLDGQNMLSIRDLNIAQKQLKKEEWLQKLNGSWNKNEKPDRDIALKYLINYGDVALERSKTIKQTQTEGILWQTTKVVNVTDKQQKKLSDFYISSFKSSRMALAKAGVNIRVDLLTWGNSSWRLANFSKSEIILLAKRGLINIKFLIEGHRYKYTLLFIKRLLKKGFTYEEAKQVLFSAILSKNQMKELHAEAHSEENKIDNTTLGKLNRYHWKNIDTYCSRRDKEKLRENKGLYYLLCKKTFEDILPDKKAFLKEYDKHELHKDWKFTKEDNLARNLWSIVEQHLSEKPN